MIFATGGGPDGIETISPVKFILHLVALGVGCSVGGKGVGDISFAGQRAVGGAWFRDAVKTGYSDVTTG